jgi:hypothetical protein
VPFYGNTSISATPTTGSRASTITSPPGPFNSFAGCDFSQPGGELRAAIISAAFAELLAPGTTYDEVAAIYLEVQEFLNDYCPNSGGIDGLLLYRDLPECLLKYQSASKLFRASNPTGIFVFSVSTACLILCWLNGNIGYGLIATPGPTTMLLRLLYYSIRPSRILAHTRARSCGINHCRRIRLHLVSVLSTPSQASADRWYSISPSAYVVYTSVSASNQCGRVGGIISRTTLAFDPGDRSTWNIPPRSLPNPQLATNIPFTGKSTQSYIMHASSRLTVAAIDYAELARHALLS